MSIHLQHHSSMTQHTTWGATEITLASTIDGIGTLYRSPFPSSSANFKSGLQRANVTHVWSLTERAASASLFPDGVTVHHEPIADFGVPSAAYLDRVVAEIEAVVRGGASALVHCQGGMGRTGTVLACVVAKLDKVSGDAAIAHLRTLFHAVETEQQEKVVATWVEMQQQEQENLVDDNNENNE
jgi:hypothetical protein